MNKHIKSVNDELSRLNIELAEEAMRSTDEEILAEIKGAGEDPTAAVERIRNSINQSIITSGRTRMDAAKAGLNSYKQTSQRIASIDAAKARRLLNRLEPSNTSLPAELTLAARNGDALSDTDVQSLVQDLIELGVLSDIED